MGRRTPKPTPLNEARRASLRSYDSYRSYDLRGDDDRHLPEDLLSEILRRLPVKSLLRFRCVSKPWLTLVDDDAFARSHLDTFKNNHDQTCLFVVGGKSPQIFSVRSSNTFESISEIPFVDPRRNFLWSWEIVSCVDGLVLLSLGHNVLKLWNPSLRKFHQVPPFRSCDKPPEIIGLGYDPLRKDYKIVRYNCDGLSPVVGIYTLGAGSWKIIPFQSNRSLRLGQKISLRSLYLQGSLYFLHRHRPAHRSIEEDKDCLWSFDLSSEVFNCITMPGDFDKSVHPYLFLVGGSSLAVYECQGENLLWVLESETMNWTKRCLWSNATIQLWYCKKNGEMLTSKLCYEWYRLVSEVASYCLEKEEFITLQRSPFYNEIIHVSAYVESLILCKLK